LAISLAISTRSMAGASLLTGYGERWSAPWCWSPLYRCLLIIAPCFPDKETGKSFKYTLLFRKNPYFSAKGALSLGIQGEL
jgi:hypothetical protein